jgi:hypothetical protein
MIERSRPAPAGAGPTLVATILLSGGAGHCPGACAGLSVPL